MKVVYKITFPNGKIYIGQDITDDIMYFGSFKRKLVEKDLTTEQRRDFTIRKQILWESDTGTKREVNIKEKELIISNHANDPSIGYNQRPKYSLSKTQRGSLE